MLVVYNPCIRLSLNVSREFSFSLVLAKLSEQRVQFQFQFSFSNVQPCPSPDANNPRNHVLVYQQCINCTYQRVYLSVPIHTISLYQHACIRMLLWASLKAFESFVGSFLKLHSRELVYLKESFVEAFESSETELLTTCWYRLNIIMPVSESVHVHVWDSVLVSACISCHCNKHHQPAPVHIISKIIAELVNMDQNQLRNSHYLFRK